MRLAMAKSWHLEPKCLWTLLVIEGVRESGCKKQGLYLSCINNFIGSDGHFRHRQPHNKTTQDLKLPSGKTVRIQPAWQLKVLNHEPALMLDYETDLKLADRDALRMEADEVWAIFKKDVEAGPFNKAQ